MFNFLKKKKKDDVAVQEQNQPITEETVQETPQAEEVPTSEEAKPETATPSEDITAEQVDISEEDKEEFLPPDINIRISPDNLTVYVKAKTYSDQQVITPTAIQDMFDNTGIKFGIDSDAIKKYCSAKEYHNEVAVAYGVEPVAGTDGFVKYNFETEDTIKLVENDNGIVDFRELNLIKSVRTGEVLCVATPPIAGSNGTNVYGEPILAKEGKAPDLKFGENTILSSDSMTVTAGVDGCIEYKNGTVAVNELYTVRGDVNSAVGNLDCLGSILINGDVREGFIIKAKKDIVIKGVIEGAYIYAGGSITISNGMNGMNIGEIEAEGDIISKYFENTIITSKSGSVYSDVIINSTVHAKESVILKGGKGSLIGGSCTAGKMIYAAAIGARTNVPTSLVIESKEFRDVLLPDQENVRKKEALRAEIMNLEAEQRNILDRIEHLSSGEENQTITNAKKELAVAKADVTAEINAANKKLEEINAESHYLGEYKIIATKTCFSGVRLAMAYLYMHTEDDYANTKFFISDHKITAGQILPSDKLK